MAINNILFSGWWWYGLQCIDTLRHDVGTAPWAEWLEIEGGAISSLVQQAIAAFAGGDHPLTLHPAGEAVGRRFEGDGERHRSSPLPPAADALRAHLLQSAENQSQYRLRLFASQKVRIKQVGKEIWLVTFMDYDLGYVDHGICRLEPLENPFAAKVLPMSPE
jgi:putative transposase